MCIRDRCIEKRGEITNQTYLTTERVELTFDMPLAEIVFDFYDRLKTVSKGYASFDYSPIGMRASKLVRVDVLINGSSVDALSALIHADNAYTIGKKMCEKLRELIPRQQFDIPIQAAIGAKIISRETIKALRKDVTAKCYGGDISRKRKLLEKQKKREKENASGWKCRNTTTSIYGRFKVCLLYTSPSPRDQRGSRMPSSA